MEDKSRNKILKMSVVLLIIISVILIILSLVLANKYEEQKQLVATLKEEIGKNEKDTNTSVQGEEIEELIEILDESEEGYLGKIGLNDAKELPVFENINEADPDWLWGNVRYCFQLTSKDNFDYDTINQYAKTIYGSDFKVELPKDGGYGFSYDSQNKKYNVEEENDDDSKDKYMAFYIKDVKKKNNKESTVDIVEYIIERKYEGDKLTELILYDKNGKNVKSYKINEYDENSEEYNEENTDDYEEKMTELEEDCKELEPTKRIQLQINDRGIYSIVSISKL